MQLGHIEKQVKASHIPDFCTNCNE